MFDDNEWFGLLNPAPRAPEGSKVGCPIFSPSSRKQLMMSLARDIFPRCEEWRPLSPYITNSLLPPHHPIRVYPIARGSCELLVANNLGAIYHYS